MSKKNEKKWSPLDNGTKVRTTRSKTKKKDWTPEAWKSRKWNVEGSITGYHDSHGLCYEVKHDDGTLGCYDPSELKVLE
ncbi:hypothetical protein JW977_02775 [Candidatus Falkowbacteria bacterium]|nr:hypothetical protein [Candidatus Falkowbacteria bacterium]